MSFNSGKPLMPKFPLGVIKTINLFLNIGQVFKQIILN